MMSTGMKSKYLRGIGNKTSTTKKNCIMAKGQLSKTASARSRERVVCKTLNEKSR